jgi:spermidine synthase
MILESVLILHYQTRVGALFQDIGALLTAFMAGLTLGAWLMGSRTARAGHPRLRGAAIGGSLACLALGVAWLLAAGVPLALVGLGVPLLLVGALVGALLAHASAGAADPGALAAPLYAADVVGGCVGALLGSLVLIPLLGLGMSCLAVALLAVGALLLV